MAAHFVPGSENLSTNPLIARARELPRLMKVFEVSAKQSRVGSELQIAMVLRGGKAKSLDVVLKLNKRPV